MLPEPTLKHLARMTDRIGLFEHARGSAPRPEHGYCTDDAGRALAVICDWDGPDADLLAGRYLTFLKHMHLGVGRFSLRIGHDPRVTGSGVSDDACGRAILGLGTAAAHAGDPCLAEQAAELFAQCASFRSPWLHAMAYAALGAAAALEADPNQIGAVRILETAASMIVSATGRRNWPEPRLRYANALLPECLLAAGARLNRDVFQRTGLRLLEWLVSTETAPAGHFSFTPTSGRSDDVRPGFDQQPIEAGAMADAAARAFALTGERFWAESAVRAAEWFAGRNDLGVAMFDDRTGGCFDGLNAGGPNLNQGAESTVAMLTALRQAHSLTMPPIWNSRY